MDLRILEDVDMPLVLFFMEGFKGKTPFLGAKGLWKASLKRLAIFKKKLFGNFTSISTKKMNYRFLLFVFLWTTI